MYRIGRKASVQSKIQGRGCPITFSVSQRVCSKDNHTLLFKVRILDKHVGLISIYKQGDGLILLVQGVGYSSISADFKSCSITTFHILMQ